MMVHPNTAIHFIFAQVVTVHENQILAKDIGIQKEN